jgi:hypothetical protein
MPQFAELRHAIDQAHEAIVADPLHHLAPYLRLAIYQAFETEPGPSKGQARIALVTARQVLPLWQSPRPNDNIPDRLIALTEGVLDGHVPAPIAERSALAAWHRLDRLGRERVLDRGAFYSCSAAREALEAALGRPPFGDVAITERYAEDDLDPYCSDTAHWAMRAWKSCAEGAAAEAAKRREFWHWWLTEAVPQAWHAASAR